MTAGVPTRVFDPARLAAVRATGLLDSEAEEPFDRLASLAATLLDAPMAFITIVDDARSYWKSCIGVDAQAPPDRQNAVEESFCQYVVGTEEPLIAGDAAADPRTRDNPSIKAMGVAAWAGFPLLAPDGEVLGTFCVVDSRVRTWTTRDVEVLSTLSLAAAGEIALRSALRAAAEQAERSEALARMLQESLLPPLLPASPQLDMAARFRPAGEGVDVLGDFYDVFEAEGHWHAVVGDVCGKGVVAARVTGLARWTVRAAAMRSDRPSDVLADLHEALLGQPLDEHLHLTAALARLTVGAQRTRVELCTAGHVPALVRRHGGEVAQLGEPGTLLGAVPHVELADAATELAPGDQLVLYTDGVIEARRGRRSYFGEERLASLVSAHAGDAQSMADAVMEAVVGWSEGPLRDDAAVLVIGLPG